MLDQNTDRMWYVIGAIVIGAAIIAMGLNIYSDSIASVDDMMVQQVNIADSMIVDNGFGVLDTDGINLYDRIDAKTETALYWANGLELSANPSGVYTDGTITTGFIKIHPGESLVVTIDGFSSYDISRYLIGGLYYNKDNEYLGAYYSQNNRNVKVPIDGSTFTYTESSGIKPNVDDTVPQYVRFSFRYILRDYDIEFEDLDIRIERAI